MTTSFAQDAIALLIDLAQRGEINPWDVQVIEVFDRCLSELASRNQQDLSRSGQAFLYASMLVLLKADSLVAASAEDESSLLEESLVDVELDDRPLPPHLERCLRRRAIAQLPQKRRVTLNELISHLKLMAATVEEKTNRPRLYRPRRQSRAQAVRAISQLAHQENLLEVAVELEQYITQYWSESQDQWLDLEALLEFKNDRIGIFWALLFLSSQSKVELCQSEFYQDLKLRPLSPTEAPLSN